MQRLLVDLNYGGRMDDGRGISYLVRGERRDGDLPADLHDGKDVLLVDYDGFPDGSPAWIEIPARLQKEDDGWSAVWDWEARRWVPRN